MSTVLHVLLALPVCHADRAWSGKRDQLETIAHVIEQVASAAPAPRRRAAELVSVGWNESRFCRSVQERKRGPGHGYWQAEVYIGSVDGGLDPQTAYVGAWNASRALARSGQCGTSAAGRFTAYAGRPCGPDWPTLGARVQVYYWAYGALTRLGAWP